MNLETTNHGEATHHGGTADRNPPRAPPVAAEPADRGGRFRGSTFLEHPYHTPPSAPVIEGTTTPEMVNSADYRDVIGTTPGEEDLPGMVAAFGRALKASREET